MNGLLATNVRDKIALLGIILFGILSFVTIWVILGTTKPEAAVLVAMISQITTVVAILGTIFKGISPPPSTTTETTSSTQPHTDGKG